jgi:hypothetical protein
MTAKGATTAGLSVGTVGRWGTGRHLHGVPSAMRHPGGVGAIELEGGSPPSFGRCSRRTWPAPTSPPKAPFSTLPGTDYALCVYDTTAGTPSLALAARIPAGGTCGTRPC